MCNAAKFVCVRWAVEICTLKPNVAQLAKAVAAVQPEERERLMKFNFFDDFLLSLVGRLLMRKFVAQYTTQVYHEVRFARDEKNKPFWIQGDEKVLLSFSTSHQSSLVVFAGVVTDRERVATETRGFGVGIDVMKIEYRGGRPLWEYFRLMHKNFTTAEWEYIQHSAFTKQQQIRAFMRLWTLKEALTKEQGVGILMNLQNLHFSVDTTKLEVHSSEPTTNTQVYVKGELAKNYIFEEHLLLDNYCVALAFRDIQLPMAQFTFLTFDELLVEHELSQQPHIIEYCHKALAKECK